MQRNIEILVTNIPGFISVDHNQAGRRRRETYGNLTYGIEEIKAYFRQGFEPESSSFAQRVVELVDLIHNAIIGKDVLVWFSHSLGILGIEDGKSGTIFTIRVEQQEPLLIYEIFFLTFDDAILIIRNLLTEIVNAMDHR